MPLQNNAENVNMSGAERKDLTLDPFTSEFKRLKAKNPPPDLTNVLDLCQISPQNPTESERVICFPVIKTGLKPIAGLRPCEEWKAFQFIGYPGFIAIQNPFIDGYQRYWVARCLQDFPSDKENMTNLSALGAEKGQDLWREFVASNCSSFSKQDPLRKLRWTTLGYHYNWTTKEYSEDLKAKFPSDVNCLTQYLAACLGFGTYSAEAGIVNYYHLDSTLAGHTDHSELDQCAPLFSISFGQSAIFLLGGQTKSEKPMPIYLRSGDICVMSGACRLAYHAVPRILASPHGQPIPQCFGLTNTKIEPGCVGNDSLIGTDSHEDSTKDSNWTISRNAVVGELNSKSDTVFNVSSTTTTLLTDKAIGIYPSMDETRPVSEHENQDFEFAAKTEASHQKTLSHNSESKRLSINSDVLADSETLLELVTCDERKKLLNPLPLEYTLTYNTNVFQVNENIDKTLASIDFKHFEVYLKSSRINLNIRQVLPPDCTHLPEKIKSTTDGHPQHLCDEQMTDVKCNVGQESNAIVFHSSRSKSVSPCLLEVTKKSRRDF